VPFVLLGNVRVRHAGDVVADDPGQGFGFGFLLITVRKPFRVPHPEVEEVGDDAFSGFFFGFEDRGIVEVGIEEFFSLAALEFSLRAEAGEAVG
jgi:hypothetical protein